MDVTALIDDHMLACIERQLAFAEVIGQQAYEVDLQRGLVRFAEGLELDVGLLGSAAPGPNSWLWGWANPTGYPDAVLAAARAARAFGEQHGVAELATGEVPLSEHWDATKAAVAAIGATGVPLYLPLDAGGGTQVVLAVHRAPELSAPHPEPTRLGPTLNQAIAGGLVTDWRRALAAYARWRGGTAEPDGAGAIVLGPAGGDTGARVEVDELGRVRSLSLTRAAGAGAPPAPPLATVPPPEEPPQRRGLFGRRRR